MTDFPTENLLPRKITEDTEGKEGKNGKVSMMLIKR